MTRKLNILSLNISEQKGTIKTPVNEVYVSSEGFQGDAHAGAVNRQVSLLGIESIQKFESLTNQKYTYGDFAENITTQGFALNEAKPLDRIKGKFVEFEVTQIGKKCHGSKCTIFNNTGNCIMPTDGIFCRVIKQGKLKTGDELEYLPYKFNCAVITLSDRASAGQYEDKSGDLLNASLSEYFTSINSPCQINREIIPDDENLLSELIKRYSEDHADIIFTTGGTGIGPRDITPDVIKSLIHKEIPGIMEYIRCKYGAEIPGALLSRSVAGTIGKSLIFALPGSSKAVKEYFTEISKILIHSIYMLHGLDKHT